MRIWLLVCCLFAATAWAEAPAGPLPADVRMIIDISGSMKKTDPQNLRRPAVDLMVRLLPDNSKAGIWTFGQSVNMLVPFRTVDAAWRKSAATSAKAINSIALYTNIGEALEKVTDDIDNLDPHFRHNLVLLTDGVVDIDKEAVKNLNERKRILTQLLPRLKSAGYVIHTIALSDAADQELMKKLSQATDGVFVVAKTADDLMKTFLKIFDQAVPAERLPLDQNGFLVDASIKEFTALIFRKAEVPATIIIAPDGSEYSDTDPAHNVNWYKTAAYDLITVQQPQAGQWRVKTDMAPNSRVTVVSNLQLVVAPPKSNIKLGQALELSYSFRENDQVIVKPEFLQLLTANAMIARESDPAGRSVDLTQEPPSDGVFNTKLEGFDEAGDYDVRLSIDGKTFKREYVHHLQVNASAFKLEKHFEQQPKPTYFYQLVPDPELVDIPNTQVNIHIANSLGDDLDKALNLVAGDHWEFSFAPVQTAKYTLVLKATGKALDGSPLEEVIQADNFYFPDEASVNAALHPQAPTSSAAASSEPEQTPAPAVEEAHSNLWLYLGIGLANILVLGLGFVVYRLIVGGKDKAALNDIEATLQTDLGELKNTSVANKPGSKKSKPAVIDIADDQEMPDIPMQDSSLSSDDQQMADNLFPLDNLEDPKDKK